MTDLQDYVKKVKQSQKGSIEPIPEIRTTESFVLNSEQIRDPFIVTEKANDPDEGKVESGVRPDTSRPKEELEAYELDSLRMVGTVNASGALWGLVKASDGTIHRVRAGNFVGKNYGKIVNIKDSTIELIEVVADSPGSWHERKAALELAEATGGAK